MPAEIADVFPGVEVPDSDDSILAGRHNEALFGGDFEIANRPAMSLEHSNTTPMIEIPHPHSAVGARRQHPRLRGVPADGADKRLVPL